MISDARFFALLALAIGIPLGLMLLGEAIFSTNYEAQDRVGQTRNVEPVD